MNYETYRDVRLAESASLSTAYQLEKTQRGLYTIHVSHKPGCNSCVAVTHPDTEERWVFICTPRDATAFAVGMADCYYDSGYDVAVSLSCGHNTERKVVYDSRNTEKSPYQCWGDFRL